MKNIAIKVQNLTKTYKLYNKPSDRLKEALHPLKKKYHNEFHALHDISFTIEKGETVGIIGHNGAGKSTLLKIITGVLSPTHGHVHVNGKIASLLELGAGFNPEYTGIENIYLQGTLIGYTYQETEQRLDRILQFADINDFVYQPVKSYSSGMFARLAFAIAINVDPDILIVDEALSVGDMNFQAKCMTAMDRIKQKGTTILFVSHDINSVKSLCERGIYIKNGVMHAIGKASDVAEQYIKEMRENLNDENIKFSKYLESDETKQNKNIVSNDCLIFKISNEFEKKHAQFRYGSGEVKICYVELLDGSNNPIIEAEFNQNVKVRIHLESYAKLSVAVNFQIFDDKKINIVAGGFKQIGEELLSLKENDRFIIDYDLKLPLFQSNYSIQAVISTFVGGTNTPVFIDCVPDAYVFQVGQRPGFPIWSKVDLFPTLKINKIKENFHD
ncbi:ABC transporter ATP-binding protein [Sulfurimonas sp.]|uniref:ABC transporter ATP-binding protein n=1 Tax=Sulfurimonas sp. TaxID=2022749 RepID=UPI00260D34A1|nr:ABC transporter ATP-binding protein [Sulfurimonas sp.]MDD5157884.1 ABC transporter ATP-binding protein [Sulfurimonas sp.]